MLQSSRLKINYPDPLRTDSADVPRDIGSIIAWLEGNAMGYGQGTLAARPTSSAGTPGVQGRIYVATDQTPHQAFYDFGTGWDPLNAIQTGAIRGSTTGGVQQEISQGSIQPEDLNARVQTIPVGAVVDFPWASGSIPAWSLLPYGQAIARANYAALATLDTASGTPHGVSAGNIVLPDYRGRVGVGKDDMGGVAANRITLAISGANGTTLGAVFGAEGITLTTGQLPAHNHTGTASGTTSAPNLFLEEHGTGGTGYPFGSGVSDGNVTAQHTHTFSASFTTANTGSGSAHQNTQPSVIINKIMRVL